MVKIKKEYKSSYYANIVHFMDRIILMLVEAQTMTQICLGLFGSM